MLGKRKTTMRRTSSVSLIGSGSVNGDSSPLPEHPKEKLKFSNYPSPGASCCTAPRQVIGFHPKVFIEEELELPSAPISPHQVPVSQRSSSKSPSGSPRSGLGDLLAGSRPWERKDEGVGLGIVAALSGSQEEVCKEREDSRGFSVPVAAANDVGYGSRRTGPPQAHGHIPSVFAPSRASPPIPIHPASLHSNSGRHSPKHCTEQSGCPTVSFGLGPTTFRPESLYVESNGHQSGVGSRPSVAAGAPWSRYPNAHNEGAVNWSQHADMELDRNEPHVMYHAPASHHLMHSARQQKVHASESFSQVFLNACHLCKRRLGEGRDIYIYRGDKAFCSPECRHQQIMNDEQRPERCAAAVMKVGGGSDSRGTAQRSRVIAGGTATAAAA
ncbi:unnamed protein product [Calypogeia fissa]